MSGYNRFPLDAELMLNDGSAAITTSAYASDGDPLSLDVMNAYWNGTNGEVGEKLFAIVCEVTATDGGDNDETYTLELHTGSDDSMSNAVVQASKTVARGVTGQFVFYVDPRELRQNDADAAFVDVDVNVAGTTPSITALVYAAPVLHAE
jgi:hypothetical protein